MPPRLAIGVVTMCHELLRLKRGEKADVKFISGFPSVRPGFSAAALREALGLGKGFEHFLALLQEDGAFLKQGSVAFWLKSGFLLQELLAAGFKAKDVFLAAVDLKIGAKVRLQLDAPYNVIER